MSKEIYHIYHIPGVKIGCSLNPKRRVKQQGYSEYEILETHTDIYVASKREKELQNQYQYVEKCIKTDYAQQLEFARKGQEACRGKKGKGAEYQIKNKIGMFGYSKEERLAINTRANKIRAEISAQKRRKPVDVYDYKTNNFLQSFGSITEASKFYKAGHLKATLYGRRNHSNGVYAKFK